jgi:hypothetical protein
MHFFFQFLLFSLSSRSVWEVASLCYDLFSSGSWSYLIYHLEQLPLCFGKHIRPLGQSPQEQPGCAGCS